MSDQKDTPESIREQIAVCNEGKHREEMALREKIKQWDRIISDIQFRYPHANMNSASYLRWCCDCGKQWNTT